jgi:hypothetical protein
MTIILNRRIFKKILNYCAKNSRYHIYNYIYQCECVLDTNVRCHKFITINKCSIYKPYEQLCWYHNKYRDGVYIKIHKPIERLKQIRRLTTLFTYNDIFPKSHYFIPKKQNTICNLQYGNSYTIN